MEEDGWLADGVLVDGGGVDPVSALEGELLLVDCDGSGWGTADRGALGFVIIGILGSLADGSRDGVIDLVDGGLRKAGGEDERKVRSDADLVAGVDEVDDVVLWSWSGGLSEGWGVYGRVIVAPVNP